MVGSAPSQDPECHHPPRSRVGALPPSRDERGPGTASVSRRHARRRGSGVSGLCAGIHRGRGREAPRRGRCAPRISHGRSRGASLPGARRRAHPSDLPLAQGRSRASHEYVRYGAMAFCARRGFRHLLRHPPEAEYPSASPSRSPRCGSSSAHGRSLRDEAERATCTSPSGRRRGAGGIRLGAPDPARALAGDAGLRTGVSREEPAGHGRPRRLQSRDRDQAARPGADREPGRDDPGFRRVQAERGHFERGREPAGHGASGDDVQVPHARRLLADRREVR